MSETRKRVEASVKERGGAIRSRQIEAVIEVLDQYADRIVALEETILELRERR